MWVLSHIRTGRRFYLLSDTKKYSVGRMAQADLSISDDTSVSREHAFIYRSSSGVRVEDLESKYGIYVNEGIDTNTKIASKTPIELEVGNIVRFGRLENTFRLENIEIKVCTSTLLQDGIGKLIKQLKVIDGVLLNHWSKECTHLVMPSVTVTVKVLQSLAHGIPIVSPAFWDAYIQCAREHRTELPNVADFVPEITEPFIIKEPNMMAVHLERQRLFQGKTFVFMVKHHMERFSPIITLAAGKCIAMDTDKVRKTFLCKPECIPMQYTPSSNTQSSADVEGIVKYIGSKGRRLISESEIGLAILHRSIDRFCNPDRKMVTDFEPNKANAINTKDLMCNVLTVDTPPQENKEQPPSNEVKVPDSPDLSGTEPNNNRRSPSPRKSTRLSSKNASTNLPDQLMPPPPPPTPQPSTSKQPQKRKHTEQAAPAPNVESVPMEQDHEQTSGDGGPTKKQKISDNDSGENSASSARFVDPIPASASQPNDFNLSGFISTQNRRNRTRATGAASISQVPQLTPSRVREQAKESRKRAIDLLDKSDSDDDGNDDGKMFNFNRKSKRAKVTSKQANKDTQEKRRGILGEDDDDDDEDGGGFTFNLSRKRTAAALQSQAKRKNTEDGDNVDASTSNAEPSQNTYKKPFQHQMNRSHNRTHEPIEFTPAQECSTAWIIRKMKTELHLNESAQSSSSLKIKDEKLEEWEMTDEEKKRKWIKSMANVFTIRKIDVNLSRSRCAVDETDNISTNPGDHTTLNGTKNFKKFVKKHNYIPHTTVIKTVPVPVMISKFARI